MPEAPSVLPGANDLEKFHELNKLTYKQQAVWFLNAFWEEFAEKEGENLWEFVLKCNELDLEKHEEGSGLDEMKAHVFLEKLNDTHTVRELRAKLRSTGAIGEKERPKVVPLTHYLLFKYNADWHALVNASQGDNKAEIQEAQEKLEAVQAAFKESEAAANKAANALREALAAEGEAKDREAEAVSAEQAAKAREAEALSSEAEAKKQEQEAIASEQAAKEKETASKLAEEEAKAREADAKAAQAELEAALAEVQKQEDAYNAKTEDLKKRSEEGGVVSRNKAKNELAQHLGEDPLPLRRAKITQEAAVKKADRSTKAAAAAKEAATAAAAKATEARGLAEKDAREASAARAAAEEASRQATAAREAAEAARAQATASRVEAEAARARSEEAKQAAEAALDASIKAVEEAEAFLQEVKAKPGCAQGALWWIERELYEQKKYLPESKGGIRK